MTAQELFDKTVTLLVRQKFASTRTDPSDGNGCLYRAPDGRRCAAGHHISDDLYELAHGKEQLGIIQFLRRDNFEYMFTQLEKEELLSSARDKIVGAIALHAELLKHVDLLQRMQFAHDSCFPRENTDTSAEVRCKRFNLWRTDMCGIADTFDLMDDVLRAIDPTLIYTEEN